MICRQPNESTASYIARLRDCADALEREEEIAHLCQTFGYIFLSTDKHVAVRACADGIEVLIALPGGTDLGEPSAEFVTQHLKNDDAGKLADTVLLAIGRHDED